MRERNDHDYYRTPYWCCGEALVQMAEDFPSIGAMLGLSRARVLDPCSGGRVSADGTVTEQAPYATFIEGMWGNPVVTNDIRQDADSVYHVDFEEFSEAGWDLICSNPPFTHAELFVRRSMALTRDGGLVMFLLRNAFFESVQRWRLWTAYPPAAVYYHSRRPSFGCGGTERGFCHVVWQVGTSDRTAIMRWLPGTMDTNAVCGTPSRIGRRLRDRDEHHEYRVDGCDMEPRHWLHKSQ